MWKREGRGALPRPAATWAADTVVSRCSDTAHEWSARRRIAESLSAAVGILGRHLSRSSYIRSQMRTPGEKRITLCFLLHPVGRFGFGHLKSSSARIGVRRCPSPALRMSGCPFKHPAVSKLLAAALISVVGGVFRAATTQYRRLIRLHTRSLSFTKTA